MDGRVPSVAQRVPDVLCSTGELLQVAAESGHFPELLNLREGVGQSDCLAVRLSQEVFVAVKEPTPNSRPVGLDYSIWPGQCCGLGSSLSDLFGRLPARALSARQSDGAGPAKPPRMPNFWCSGTRTRYCAARSAGSATSQLTGCGSRPCRS